MGKKNIGQKRDNWFNEYHDIPELDITGTRKINERIAHYHIDDFKDATVIDLGCNMGQMTFQAEKWGASKVIGVEFDAAAISNAADIKEKLNSNAIFVVDDLDSNFFWNSLPTIDVVMFLAVIDTHELENRYGILSKACAKTGKVMYFEGHGKQPPSKYLRNIIEYTDFSQIVYKGNTPVNRPFFRCTRDVIDEEQFIQKIINSNHNKIAVVGKSLAGKSSFRQKYWQTLTDLGYSIIDDLRHVKTVEENEDPTMYFAIDKIKPDQVGEFNKFILFDYRAAEYYNQFESVFFMTTNIDMLGNQTRERKRPHRSPSIKNFDTIKEIYTVRTY